ncbi:cobyrinate a,c-diamide synthase [Listeria cossartiae subsp. cayugensis]|uniref:cobyrinate a,c-diamide synthase n=1 Tax=Listeria cossartiae TaxID=2838249 RepID=UPI0028802937|nr:cobyrinate a,c-diamide synthase [Listeria cossartiae]MDT0002795.1 cobyrinate a,c-diamide synthase [Listeria cossartiae subsp. cayugensis]MDT0018837.1 cobyrinate a,c-diamide synthase [Listeria cossartiae subsp. cayugensis]MDT0035590.1 cobyrinate a,c-diamide synthase [Listeria cossartiae subsp. cayugensis]MDT0040587.1 cobyrinate a,c-diamide synthase [Listeria cossartiae subsp. cayugensis]MDT0046292.1 cobyrinate a,c-diamide synthase [Listeria cossartiae subsp. cayugensis]
MNKILIAAASSGAGKTTVTLGIMHALKKRGLRVQPFKVGPDYIDTNYHQAITGVASINLDSFLIDDDAMLAALFQKHGETADISVIEGVMGLFDGLGIDRDNASTSFIAKCTKTPVILVVDGKAISTSAAAIVDGFNRFDPELKIAGVIINRVASENHFSLIKGAIERYTDVPVLGYLPKNAAVALPERHLGLVPQEEMTELEAKWELLGDLIAEHVDLERLLEISKSSEDLIGESLDIAMPDFSGFQVAYALDAAFHFYYQDNLELIRSTGATLIPFSPLEDMEVPEADFIYIGGGFPEVFAERLAKNSRMRKSILAAHEKGIPIYAECGGLMYLGSALEMDDTQYDMVGVFSGISKMTTRLRKFGYCTAEPLKDTLIGKKRTAIRGHEFHHSVFETTETPCLQLSKKRDGEIVKAWQGGYQKGNTFASYLHIHFYQNPAILMQMFGAARR